MCVFNRDGYIKAVGDAKAIRSQFSGVPFEKIIDCSGKCIIPGWCIFHSPLYQIERCFVFIGRNSVFPLVNHLSCLLLGLNRNINGLSQLQGRRMESAEKEDSEGRINSLILILCNLM